MRDFRPLLIAVPSAALGALIAISITSTARAQMPLQVPLPSRAVPAVEPPLPNEAPPVRGVRFNDAFEYDYYFCASDEPCAAGGAKLAYDELCRRGVQGWEAYAYQSVPGKGFNWELRRRR